jgi:ligand-binding sensor domain-containing protein/signal transduction histidine kinase
MIAIRQNIAWGLRGASRILLLCIVHVSSVVAAQPRPATGFAHPTTKAGARGERHFQNIHAQGGHALVEDLKFAHLTTNDGLSQSNVTEILQDRRGFMWFATLDGLNRYDGNAFVVYKHNPNDPGSLSANYIWDLMEDDQGYLWIATNSGGVSKFDPTTERFASYRHDPNNPNSISGDSVETIARDSRGYLWFGEGGGLDKFDPSTGTFTHYRNDSEGQFVGRITKAIAGRQGDIWFVGERGLFHLNPETGQITRPPATITNALAADYVYEDDAGNLWMLAWSPIVGLVKYDRQAERLTKYSVGAGAVGVASSNLLADGQNGFWVPSSQGLYYFDRRTERFKYRFQHDETNPDSLDDNTVVAIYQDRGGMLWAGTGNGLNLLNLREEQFGRYQHLPNSPNTLSPGKVTAIYEEPNGILWVGFQPRALDRLDRKTGEVTHYVPSPENKNALGKGKTVAGIYKDARGYLWLGGWGSGLDRLDERNGQFKHYRYNPGAPNSLISDGVYNVYGDRSGHIWVGQLYGLSRLDPATEQFTHYRTDPRNPTWNGSSVWGIYQDRSGTLWFGTTGGALIRIDDKTETLVNYPPDSRDPHKLNGGAITAIYEDRAGTLWVGAWDGLYRYNRQNETFTRYTESQGLPSSVIQGILEDKAGRLWLGTKKGISRFDPQTETFRNYDVSDGLQGDDFSTSCYQQGPDGEMFFGGSKGFNAFFPENIRDNPYVPPVAITSFKIFNKPVPIGARSVLTKAISYLDGLTLSYRDNVFSFEFAALSYANSHKNRYRYKLENFEPGWNEVGSAQRLATYTNLDPGKYVFRVQGSNSDGVWNEEGVSLPILITPPWWSTNWFRTLCAATFLALLWAAYQFRVGQLQREFTMRLGERLDERGRIARELHDTLLQSFQGLMFSFQAARNLLPGRTEEAIRTLDGAIGEGDEAIAEGRDAIQGLRASPGGERDLEYLLTVAGKDLARSSCGADESPAFRVTVEGTRQPLSALLRDEVYRIAREILQNAFRHAHASRIELEIAYDRQFFRLRIRDNGKGIDRQVLEQGARQGHWGLPGVRERAKRIGARLKLWSEPGAGTEAELTVPARMAYRTVHGRERFRLFRRNKVES